MILSTRLSVKILDLFFDEPLPAGVQADIVRYVQFSRPVPGMKNASIWTMLLDTTQQPSEMLSKMKNHTRYKLRRAEKDEFEYEHFNGTDGDSIIRFGDHYDRYASMKGLSTLSRRRYRILADHGALDLSFMLDRCGEILVASSCLLTESRVRGLHLAAAFRGTSDPSRRSLIGRANRYLRWRDILRFRQAGIRTFDFGGWYRGQGDAVRTNAFKAEFCGDIVEEFMCVQALTLKGRIASLLFDGYSRLMMFRGKPESYAPESEDRESSVPA
jgi:hypothetical protein